MKMQTLTLTSSLSDEETNGLIGTFLDSSHYEKIVGGALFRLPLKIERPDGSPVAIFLPKSLSNQDLLSAHKHLRKAAKPTMNRGTSAGEDKVYKVRKNGEKSRTLEQANPVNSGVIGFFDRYPRIPFCRQTAFNLENPDGFRECLPLVKDVDRLLKLYLPERYAAQRQVADKASADFVIKGTAFTTVTVNKNFRTAAHKDAGDLKAGFGCINVLRTGSYRGGLLVFPKWKIAINLDSQDLLLFDPHEVHGNTEMIPTFPDRSFERVSCVYYFREGISECGTVAEELQRAQNQERYLVNK